MPTSETRSQKAVVQQLDSDSESAKRVTWEAWRFTVSGFHLVEVANASDSHLKDNHQYAVGVPECDKLFVPSECDCAADSHGDGDCKHKLALAPIGSDLVLRAAV